MASSEIEKLEQRYRENPRGLAFVPLAEYYRKGGDHARALELVHQGLEHHPDHVPASIVLGRCHLDLGDDAAAETDFARVLSLDPENVIALKALADVTERQGRVDEAERWLSLLLSVDRSNDDARAQLDRVRSAPPAAVAPESAATPEPADGVPAEAEVFSFDRFAAAELAPEPPTEAAAPDQVSPDQVSADEVSADETTDDEAAVEPASEAPSVDEAVSEADAAGSPLAGLDVLPDDDTPLAWVTPPSDETSANALPLIFDDFTPTVEIERDPTLISEEQPEVERDVAPLEGLVGQGRTEPPGDEAPGETAPDAGGEDDDFRVVNLDADLPLGSDAPASRAPSEDVPLYQRYNATDELQAEWSALSEEPSEVEAAEVEFADSAVAEPAADAVEPVADAADADAGAGEASVLEIYGPTDDVTDGPTDDVTDHATNVVADDAEIAEEPAIRDAVTEELPTAAEAAPAVVPEGPRSEELASDLEAVEADLLPTLPVVVTESMAELYVAQGHRAEALRIYRELAERRPEEERLRRRADELEAEEAAAAVASAAASYAAAQSGGVSVRELLGAVLAARLPEEAMETAIDAPESSTSAPSAPPAEAARATPGAPTRPADDHLSLSAVFGDEAPAAPAPAALPPAGERASVSFDEFFDPPPAEAADATRVARPSRPSEAPSDDLDQFNAWLQNLKR